MFCLLYYQSSLKVSLLCKERNIDFDLCMSDLFAEFTKMEAWKAPNTMVEKKKKSRCLKNQKAPAATSRSLRGNTEHPKVTSVDSIQTTHLITLSGSQSPLSLLSSAESSISPATLVRAKVQRSGSYHSLSGDEICQEVSLETSRAFHESLNFTS